MSAGRERDERTPDTADYDDEALTGAPEASYADDDSFALEADAYSPEYLRDCADEEARSERLEELKRRISLNAYAVDTDRIAEELLERGLLDRGK